MAEDDQSIFKQPETALEEAGFNQLLVREEDFFAQPIKDLGAKSTPLTVNILDNQVVSQQLLDQSIADVKIVTNHRVVTGSALTLDRGDTIIQCDTTSNAIAITLPDSRKNLGKSYIIGFVTDGGNDVTVSTDGTDQYDGASSATGTSVVYADAGDMLAITAIGNDLWLVTQSVGGSFS